MPSIMMTPIMDVVEIVVCVRNNINQTPVRPSGIENMMMKGSTSDLNCAANHIDEHERQDGGENQSLHRLPLLLDLPAETDAETRWQLQLRKALLEFIRDTAQVTVHRIGGDVDHALEVFSLNPDRTGVELDRGQIFEQDRLAGPGGQDHVVVEVAQLLPVGLGEPGADVILVPVLRVGIDDRLRLSIADE